MTSVEFNSSHQDFNFPFFRCSPLSVQVSNLQNKPNLIASQLTKTSKMSTPLHLEHNKLYEPKMHFPPSSCNCLASLRNEYSNKSSCKDLLNSLEVKDDVPAIYYDSSSDQLEPSSSNSSPSPPNRYCPPEYNKSPGRITANNPVVSNASTKMLSPIESSDLQKYLLKYRNNGTLNGLKTVEQNIHFWLRKQTDLEKNECLNKINSVSMKLNEYSLNDLPRTLTQSLSVPQTSTSCSPDSETSPYKSKQLGIHDEFHKTSSRYNPPSPSEPNNFKKRIPIITLCYSSEWLVKRNQYYKKIWQECDDCICNRPSINIICRVCGFTAFSRLKRTCKLHPNTIFLTDIEQCGTCHTYAQLGLFHEINFK